jgi:acyl-CoA thioesterase-1
MPRVRYALLLPLLLLTGPCAPDIPNLDSPGTTIVCLGDSITSGVGADPGLAYPDVLADRLGVDIINAGVPGDTAADGLERLDEVLEEDPWLVIVELGGNDLLRRVPPASTEAALREIVQRLLDARVVPLVVEMEVPFGRRYSEIYDRLREEYEIPVVEGVLGDILVDSALKADPIHPNTRGHEILAEAVAEAVQPLIEAREEAR